MASLKSLTSWFKKNILRMSDEKPTVDISSDFPIPIEETVEKVEDVVFPLKIKMVGTTLTAVTKSGKIYSKVNATLDSFYKLEEATTIQEVEAIFYSADKLKSTEVKKQEEIQEKKVSKSFEVLSSFRDMFIVKDESVYLNREGIDHRSMPKLLVEKFAGIIIAMNERPSSIPEDEYLKAIDILVRFWEKCCLCPSAQSAEDLYGFLQKHKFKIDEYGNFYTYRRVLRVDDKSTQLEKDLVDFVSNAYNKVKAVWKEKPAKYDVYKKDKEFKITKSEKVKGQIKAIKIGDLEELYTKSLSSMKGNRFTDHHTKREDYRVGEIISMPRYQGDSDNKVSCGSGYHVASKAYNYSGFGDTPILAIVNPIDVLSVPRGEEGKMRVCRWFFAMTLDPKEEHILDDDRFDVRHLGDVFEAKCLENLSEHVEKIYAEEVKSHKFKLPSMEKDNISKVIVNLEKIKNDLRSRIQKAV